MAASDEEHEQLNAEPTDSSDKFVVLLNKTPKSQTKPTEFTIKQNASGSSPANSRERIHQKMNLTKSFKRKPEQPDKNEEIDFIVLEEQSQDEPLANDMIEPILNKKLRAENEKTTNQRKETSQDEKIVEISNRKPNIPIKPNETQKKSITDGIVSSSETVDDNKEETYFALSLVGILKRLPPHKRAIAKCHILSYLTELEYGSSSLS